jgi:hypothetical protein
MVTRRLLLAAVSLATVAPNAFAQSATERALDDFTRYLDAATDLLAEFTLGLRSANAREIRRDDGARQALGELSDALLAFHTANRLLVDDIDDYEQSVRDGGNPQELWSEVLTQAGQTATVMRRVLTVIDETPSLAVVLSAESRAQIVEGVADKGSLLERLRRISAPRTDAELTQLRQLNRRYRAVMEQLRRARVAIDRVLRRRR